MTARQKQLLAESRLAQRGRLRPYCQVMALNVCENKSLNLIFFRFWFIVLCSIPSLTPLLLYPHLSVKRGGGGYIERGLRSDRDDDDPAIPVHRGLNDPPFDSQLENLVVILRLSDAT